MTEGRQDLARRAINILSVQADGLALWTEDEQIEAGDVIEELLALLLAEAPQRQEKEEVTTRVGDSQYPSKPLATAASNQPGPTE